jgi:sugar-specific transcriptional regulator TrmB
MDIPPLREAGLTEGEAKVYLALLELGSSTTGPIVEKSGVARCIIYQLLDRLAQKGLVTHITKEKTRHFQAASPASIMDYIAERKKKLEESSRKIEEMLPRLAAMQDSAKPPEARVYVGFRGMVSAHERIYSKLGAGEGYYFLGIPAEQEEHFHSYWKRDHARRVKAGITCRLLFNSKTSDSILKNRNSYAGCDARYMPAGINAPAWIMGYKGVAVIGLQSKMPITIEIENQEIADSFKAYFEEFWNRSKS